MGTHGDWLTLSGLHPNVAVPAPNSSDDNGLSYLQKQGMPQQHHHHQMLQRQLEGMTEGSADANVNGMWIGPGNNLKGKVPMPNSMMGEQQLTESGMVWVKWNHQ